MNVLYVETGFNTSSVCCSSCARTLLAHVQLSGLHSLSALQPSIHAAASQFSATRSCERQLPGGAFPFALVPLSWCINSCVRIRRPGEHGVDRHHQARQCRAHPAIDAIHCQSVRQCTGTERCSYGWPRSVLTRVLNARHPGEREEKGDHGSASVLST